MNKKNIRKKIIITLIGIIAVVILVTMYINAFGIPYPKVIKQVLANQLFGDNSCQCPQAIVAGQALTEWRCKICKKVDIHSNTAIPELCDKCANATNRCEQCGGIKILDDKTRTDYEHYIWDIVYHYYD